MNLLVAIACCLTLMNLTNGFDDHKFATGLYKQISKDNSRNVIFSPMSIQTALSLLMFGAAGNTKQDMKDAMYYVNSNDDQIKQKFRHSSASNDLKVANKIYVAQGHSIKQNFKNIAVNNFNSDIQNVDFSNSQKAAGTINKWVEDQTNNKIKNIISEDALDVDTRMILVNAIYFKGIWEEQFDPKLTLKQQFKLLNGNSIEIDMMSKIYVKYFK